MLLDKVIENDKKMMPGSNAFEEEEDVEEITPEEAVE